MRKIVKLALAMTLSASIFFVPTITDAASNYNVQYGDSFWSIANKYGVSVASLQKVNNRYNSLLYAGETITIPTTISASDRELMARLVHAEAKGESYAGKVAVATVILNRVDHADFPDNVRDVIYERYPGGYYAFSPVKNGTINQAADFESKRAVNEAIAFRGKGNGSIYFYNPKTASSNWITTREVTVTIGNHRFAK